MALFDQPLGEVVLEPEPDSAVARAVRYLLKRNPVRAQALAESRQRKKAAVEKRLKEYNQKLAHS